MSFQGYYLKKNKALVFLTAELLYVKNKNKKCQCVTDKDFKIFKGTELHKRSLKKIIRSWKGHKLYPSYQKK